MSLPRTLFGERLSSPTVTTFPFLCENGAIRYMARGSIFGNVFVEPVSVCADSLDSCNKDNFGNQRSLIASSRSLARKSLKCQYTFDTERRSAHSLLQGLSKTTVCSLPPRLRNVSYIHRLAKDDRSAIMSNLGYYLPVSAIVLEPILRTERVTLSDSRT